MKRSEHDQIQRVIRQIEKKVTYAISEIFESSLRPKKSEPAPVTQKSIPKLPRPTKRGTHSLFYDSEVCGLCVRVTANGARSFVLNYRIRNIDHRFTIGKCDEMTLADARKEAEDLRREIQKGADPMKISKWARSRK